MTDRKEPRTIDYQVKKGQKCDDGDDGIIDQVRTGGSDRVVDDVHKCLRVLAVEKVRYASESLSHLPTTPQLKWEELRGSLPGLTSIPRWPLYSLDGPQRTSVPPRAVSHAYPA